MDELEKKVYFESKRVAKEYLNAKDIFPPFNSYHEAHAVLKEEVDELWDEIKGRDSKRHYNIQREARQVAAMALAFLVEFDFLDEIFEDILTANR